MNIDEKAPFQAEKEILIAAPLESVWSEITGFDRWFEWQPDVTSSKLDGPLAAGTKFYWKANGLNIASEIQIFEPRQSIGWTGKSLGTQAIHMWTFAEHEQGTCVRTKESLAGWFPRILKVFDPNFLDKSLAGLLQLLKARAEEE